MQPPPPNSTHIPHFGPVTDDDRVDDRVDDRDHFDPAELAIVLSHYDLGVVTRIREYLRGSRRAPKVRITSERGEFLLKRRAPGRADPKRVSFAQDLQLRLAELGYPVPRIALTRSQPQPMVRLDHRIYEVFEFVQGERDDRSVDAAQQAGRTLGEMHRLLRDHRPDQPLDAGSYHASGNFDGAVDKVPQMIFAAEPSESLERLEERCLFLRKVYHDAAARAAAAGLETWPPRVVHGDWHPGNLLFRDGVVVAVLDFDSARMEPRVVDIANAALQFSMTITDPADPDAWPEHLEVKRIRALLQGYDEAADDPVSPAEREALPWLILEALILESILPIAATGRFAQLSGAAFVRMVMRKVRWLRPRASKLATYVA